MRPPHDLDSKPSLCSPPPRGRARARRRVATHRVHSAKRVVANPVPAWRRPKRGAARSHVAPFARVASGSHVVLPDVASKRGVTCARGDREPAGIARCGGRTWRLA